MESEGIDIGEVVKRLQDLQAYSPELARRLEHEEELPDDAVAFLVKKLEAAFSAAEDAVDDEQRADAHYDLLVWLMRSFRFYMCRLAMRPETLWKFSFPARGNATLQ